MHPILFQLNGMTVHSYGVLHVLSYLAAVGLLLVTAKKLGVTLLTAEQALISMVVGILAGGRLGFMVLNSSYPWTIQRAFDPSAGFLSFTAALGGLVAVSP
jgi:prolipoprotein diacylglyceryltransferase